MKIPSKRIPSDDCTIYVGRKIKGDAIVEVGTPYHIHENEWVEFTPVRSAQEYTALMQLQNTKEIAKGLDNLCEALAKLLTAWNWTDNDGVLLSQPKNNPDVIRSLSDDEVLWLAGATMGVETQVERKNESGAIATSSSLMANTAKSATAP